jgi:hypothetical protein
MKIRVFAVEFAEWSREWRVYCSVIGHCLKVGFKGRKNKGKTAHFDVDGRGNVGNSG